MTRGLLVADDLTGACDAGIAFSGVVVLQGEVDAEWEVVSTESRDIPEQEAYERAYAVCARAGTRIVYKKIDSVMRGNVRAEVEAALDATGRRRAVVCPAFPAQGRVVTRGVVRAPGGVERAVAELFAGDSRVVVKDATTEDDLARIASAITADEVAVGSAGLARALASRWGLRRAEVSTARLPVTFVIGSPHWVTREQVAWLRASGRTGYGLIESGADLNAITSDDLGDPATLFVSGGDTALAVCRLLGVRAIQLQRELLPGIPQGRLMGGALDGRTVITKSGGFGSPNTLGCILDILSADNIDSQ